MRGARAAPFCLRPLPQLYLLPLLFLLLNRIRPQGSLGPMQCYRVGLLGDLNCSWEPLGDSGTPSTLHFQSQKYHLNRTQVVAVPPGQSWVTIPREQFTEFDTLLVWGAKADGSVWPPVSVDLETRVKLGAPWLSPDIEFLEDGPLETTVQWAPPTWLPHQEDMVCQFYYRRCQEKAWTLLEPELKSVPLTPVEIHDLELATGYEMSGRCRMQVEEELWGEWSPILSFQTPPTAPKDVWVSGNLCGTLTEQETLLLWKAPGPCVQISYRVQFRVEGQKLLLEGIPCCSSSIPSQAQWAGVSAINATNQETFTNLSLACSGFAPYDVVVGSTSDSKELLVTWRQGAGGLWEHVVAWARDGDPPENLSWVWLPPGNLSVRLPGNFERGVPYHITVTTVSPWGLAPAPSVWGFIEELAPLVGPELWRLQDAPSGTPTIAWGEVPRHQLRGCLTHYTLCVQSETASPDCMNVSGGTQNITLPNLHWGSCELWMTASTVAGQGPPGPSIQLHLPDNTLKWKVLPGVLLLCSIPLIGLALAISRNVHLQHKVLPHWVWEKVPDPANSNFGQPHIEEEPWAPPLWDVPILEVQEMEPLPGTELPQPPAALDSGYEKHFLPTPEELGLLGPPRTQVLA
ncbi:interleukin-27 receptor subunit alpha [Orycteropus afer afer]|uniref:Interleukin-27 receptor subunit alpha n=1 Tax=Orycteropus afer afer TaxID=1230840 RepID=A0A8B7AYB0_ORYAF|nr:interleukin-27 receptor subunit alpha [Orycteropus afer afer]